ncbi:MAG: hypothetical protein IJU91_01005, partial [Selenomonadaceae bacterium]|nr:hypothetical protein [Selenomonadaceae bacterium]
MNTDWRTYPFLYPLFNQQFIQRNLIIWKKGSILNAGNWYRYCYELIIFGTNGDSKRTFYAGERDFWDIPLNEACIAKRSHQSQKPLELIEKIVKN